ncbi:class I SAM-dependent methyltransferase [Corallococcus sp. EGB]|uniref:class I SAM-dependent methyltransferase n=1 Tax=Corallococcus sp. EGB TaxID=1521117 RepID=UPI001CBE2468|nr:class I SAM-dependent methyltransferase [Corallococcus sp. EGB]
MNLLPRLHLFEFLDQSWLPTPLRRGEADYLHVVLDKTRPYDTVAPQLAELLRMSGTDRIIDLCSGTGGPWRTLLPALRRLHGEAEVVLTDLHPTPVPELPEGARYRDTPVDVMRVPEELTGLRTLFEALHHFRPKQAKALLADAATRGVPIAAFELTQRSALYVLFQILLIVPLVWGFTPLIRPRRWWRLMFTYLIPIIPLLILWDGVVSSLRTYTPEDLDELTEGLDANGYRWHSGVHRANGMTITYLIGLPRRQP